VQRAIGLAEPADPAAAGVVEAMAAKHRVHQLRQPLGVGEMRGLARAPVQRDERGHGVGVVHR